jgi:hypothetical protein
MILTVTGGSTDQLRDLRRWLGEEPELRGRVVSLSRRPEEHELGTLTEALQITLGSGGVVATVAAVVIAWLRTRPAEITVRISRGDDEIEVTAKGVKSLNVHELGQAASEVARTFADPHDG